MVVCKLEPVDTEARPECSASESGTSSSVPVRRGPSVFLRKAEGPTITIHVGWYGMGAQQVVRFTPGRPYRPSADMTLIFGGAVESDFGNGWRAWFFAAARVR